jgi:DNA-binding GntR family transcriptional regulator
MGEQEAIEIRFGQGVQRLKNVAKMTPAQLEQLSAIIAEEASSARWVLTSLGRMTSMQTVLESGSFSQDEMLKAYSDSRNPVRELLQAESATPPELEKPY